MENRQPTASGPADLLFSMYPSVEQSPYKFQPINMEGSGITFQRERKPVGELPKVNLDPKKLEELLASTKK